MSVRTEVCRYGRPFYLESQGHMACDFSSWGRNAPLFFMSIGKSFQKFPKVSKKKSGSLRILFYHVDCSNVFGSHP